MSISKKQMTIISYLLNRIITKEDWVNQIEKLQIDQSLSNKLSITKLKK